MEVIKSPTLSTKFENRYVCIDDNGKVIDDAQGYGYKTKEGAYKAYAYKNRTKSEKAEYELKINKIKQYIKDHNEVINAIYDISFYGMKDGLDKKNVDSEINQFLDSIDFDFKANKISKQFFLKHLED